jgi:hypothetical protein
LEWVVHSDDVPTAAMIHERRRPPHPIRASAAAGAGFGALFFLSHAVLTEHGVVARWIGYDPFAIGLFIVSAAAFGYQFGQTSLSRHVYRFVCWVYSPEHSLTVSYMTHVDTRFSSPRVS